MRNAVIFFSICLFSSFARDVYSQETKLTLTMDRTVTIRQVISQIERQSDYFFLFSDEGSAELSKTVNNFSANNKEISEILEQLFRGTNLSFRIIDRQVIVIVRQASEIRSDRRSERASAGRQQGFTIGGTVYDSEDGISLPGVNVYLKNRAFVGTTTDANGKFSINRAAKGDVLVFTFIGYETVEYFIDRENDNITINLLPSNTQIEELVVTGLGLQRKISVVGAITTVNVNDIQTPATSIANMMGGRVAGVISMMQSGEPGKNISEFWIRGIGTFGASSAALVLIDGLEGDLNSVDPADIESFSVLKDASATAVYGVRGANGVVLVTTKRGQSGRLQITARANYTLSQPGRMPKYLRAYDYAVLANEARAVRGQQIRYNDDELKIIRHHLDDDMYPDIDWQKEVMKRAGLQQTCYMSVQGGGNAARYFVSMGASIEDAAYKVEPQNTIRGGVGFNTYNYRMNLDVDLAKNTTIYLGVDGLMSIRKQPGWTDTEALWEAQSMLTPVTVPKRYSTGELAAYSEELGGAGISPYVLLNFTGTQINHAYSGKNTLALVHDFSYLTEKLKLRVQGAYDNLSWIDERRYQMPDLYMASARNQWGELLKAKTFDRVTPMFTIDQRQSRKFHLETALTWDKLFAADHRVSVLAYYYMSDQKDTHDADSAEEGRRAIDALPKRYQGISSRITYGFRDTYLIDFNFGYTGSENFEPRKRFGFFPSIAIGWIPTQYQWAKAHTGWLNYLKIRASYGTVGSDRIADFRFPFMTVVGENQDTEWGSALNGIVEQQFGANNLVWERAVKANAGIEARLLNDRLSFVVDIFNDRRNDIFQRRETIPGHVGLIWSARPYGNVGSMRSYGTDGNIAYSHQINRDWNFTARGNYTWSQNEVINWEQTPTRFPYQPFNGLPYGAIRGYVATGLFIDEEDVENSAVQTFGGFRTMPGDIKYKDVNGDGFIDSDDMVFLSNPTFPRLMYGFGGEMRYKNLTFGVLFRGTGKTDFYHVGYEHHIFGVNGPGYLPFNNGETGNVLAVAKDPTNRWIPREYAFHQGIDLAKAENPNARFPRLTYGYNANNSQLSTWWKGDARYLRLQEVSLNYRITQNFIRKAGIASADVKLVGSNLHVWDKVKLWDPEQAWRNGRAYPITKRYTVQVFLVF